MAVTAWLEDKGQALRLLEEAAAMAVDDPRQLYAVACAAALAAHPAEEADPAETRPFLDFAMDLLNRAIDAGYQDGDSLRADADLAALYEDPGFARVLTRLPAYATTTRENTQFESRVVSNLSTALQLNEAEALRNEGFRPIAFAVASLDSHPKLTSASLWHRPWIPEETKERNAMRRANAAVVLASVGQADAIWPLLRHRPDPRLRSYLVDRLASEFVRPDAAWTQLRETEDRSVQIALLLVLGEFAKRKLLSAAQTEQLIAELSSRYARHPDAGVHGACRWALEQAGAAAEVAKIDSAFAKGAVVGNRNWYVTRTGGHSLVVLDSQEPFLMGCEVRERKRSRGANRREESPRHRRLISRRFAIGAHEVTVAQFHAFKKDHQLPREKAREDDAPVINVLWYQAASYCNWLSQQEGLPRSQWCYDPEQAFASGMMLYPDYLQRTGYRLPSEAEWEYACRAGAITARHFGETDTLLPNYAWYTKNAQDRWLLPVGTLKPNDFGLFDTLGNTFEWCQERAFPFRTDRPMMSDLESVWEAERTINRAVDDKSTRPLKGGSFFSFTRFVRDGYRRFNSPAYPSEENGFRLARTMPATDQQE